VKVERVRAEQWRALRDARLRALADAPGAFLRAYDEEAALPDEEWQQRAAERTSFLAWVDGEPAGIVGAFESADHEDTVELVAMWSAPEHRRRGVGRALVEAVVAWAQEVGAARVVLWVMRGNDGAQAFYESIGFGPTDEIAALPDDPCREEQRMVRTLR
jgi:GNAT superfamily N-acetyltransferase